MKTAFASLLLLLLVALLPARAGVDPEKDKEIRKMLDVMGTTRMINQMVDQMFEGLATRLGEGDEEYWKKFRAKVKVDELIDQIIPVYDKHYTLDDLKAINAFYSSPAGQHMKEVLPQVTQESMAIGREWGKKVAQQAVADLKAEQGADTAGDAPAPAATAAPATP